jgi:FixJ family two-component response regulator
MQRQGTVLIVDDDDGVRDSLEELVRSAGLDAQSFSSADDFLKRYQETRPACLLLDFCMPGMTGLQLQEDLAARTFDVPVIVITGHGDVPLATRSFKVGAVDFIQKPFDDSQLLEAIEQALRIDAERCRHKRWEDEIAKRLARLSDREREVMKLVVDGHANKCIATHLGITQRTVEVHRARVMAKMEADSVQELVKMVLSVAGSLS